MKSRVLTTALLMAAFLAAGCSKDESEENMEENMEENIFENTGVLTLEQLVGVWRDGDYFLSIADDGYIAAYLSERFVFTCDVENRPRPWIDGNKFYAIGNFWGVKSIEATVSELSGDRMVCELKFREGGWGGVWNPVSKQMTLTRGGEAPCRRTSEIVGKTFSYPATYATKNIPAVTGICTGTVTDFFEIYRQIDPDEGQNAMPAYRRDHYVYLPPYIYFIEYVDFMRHQPYGDTIHELPDNVIRRRVAIDGGTVSFSE